ncbi:Uncharacterised protein [Halioglobus japonicus]|nr:Uncharacterised protein [Halioglobus japonicus]
MINRGATLVSRLAVITAFLLTLAACGGGGGGSAFYDEDGGSSSGSSSSGGDTTSLVLALFNSEGEATDTITSASPGTLTVSIPGGGSNVEVSLETEIGSILPESGTALTNLLGVAEFTIVAGTETGSGTVTANATTSDGDLTGNLTINVTSSSMSLALFDSLGNETTTVTPTSPGTLRVTIEGGGAGVVVTPTSEIAVLSPVTGLTDENGIVEFQVQAGTEPAAGDITVTATTNAGEISGVLAFQVEGVGLRIGYFDENDLFIENEIKVIPGPGSTLSAGGDGQLSVVILDENGDRITAQREVTFTSGCIDVGQSTVSPPNPLSVSARAITTYSAVNCSGTDNITASIPGTNAEAFGTINVAAPETNSIKFISADSELIVLRGTGGVNRTETSDVVFQIIDQSGRPLPGVKVYFGLSTRVGQLSLSTDTGTEDGYAFSNADGEVSVTVQAGNVATVVRVLATVDDGNGNLVETTSDLLTVTTGIPDQDSISLSVETFVIPNAASEDNVTTTLTVSMADRFNNPVPEGTAAVFTTEYGAIEGRCTTNESGTCSVTWFSRPPRFPILTLGADVTTIANTGCRYFIGNPNVPCPVDSANPLDDRYTRGLRSTILVHAIGEESFVDANGNGMFDQAEAEPLSGPPLFQNIPEAFVDNNEDGYYTRALSQCSNPTSAQCIAGQEERFIDFNNNGLYDLNVEPEPIFNGLSCPIEGDGVWCSRTMLNVWDSIVITMSSNNDNTWFSTMIRNRAVVTATVTGAQQTVYISDLYNNPPTEGSTVTLSASDNCEIVGQSTFEIGNLYYASAIGIPVKTKPLDTPPEDPSLGFFTVTLNLNNGPSIPWDFECDTPPTP